MALLLVSVAVVIGVLIASHELVHVVQMTLDPRAEPGEIVFCPTDPRCSDTALFGVIPVPEGGGRGFADFTSDEHVAELEAQAWTVSIALAALAGFVVARRLGPAILEG